MGECLNKGEEYEKAKKIKQGIFILKMKYFVFGVESLTHKEVS
jgi:hypothetical protein